jgi:glycosyltransferase involved in cell wall biosynthesis
MTRPLKVAFIGARGVGGAYSGIETYYEELGSRLVERGHVITAYCRTHFTPDVPTYRGITVRRLPALRSKHLETISHSVLSTIDALRRDYDIVQFHAIGSAPLALLPRLGRAKSVVSVRGLDWQRAKWGRFARFVLQCGEWASARCPDATVVVSHTLQKHYEQAHRRRPHVIPNAVLPATRVAATIIRERYGLEADDYILYAGRISPEKNVHVLLEAMRPHAGKKKLVLAGGSSYSDGYIDTLRARTWDGVEFLGSVDRQTMNELHSNCYAYVLPSVMEGLSISLLEAVSFGSCIVTTDIPENREVVGDAALLVETGSIDQLSAILGELMSNMTLVRRMREAATQRAAEQPDWDEIAARTEEFYYGLVGAGPRV